MDRIEVKPVREKNVNWEKVAFYKKQISEGKYFVQSDEIADKLSLQIIEDEKQKIAAEYKLV